MKKLKLIDLFAGCGGMSLGFANAGFEIVAAYDNWIPAIDVYKENFNHPIFVRDLSKIEIIKELKSFQPDIIVGGPPCQDFSIAGKRNFEGKRANLTISFSEIIKNIKPKWFVMENVYNIDRSPLLNVAIQNFEKAGYGLTRGVFDASRMGVPQARKRYFIIGKMKANSDFLMEELNSKLSTTKMTVREYFGDKLDTNYYYMHPRSYNRRAIFSIDEPSSTIRGVNRPIPESYTAHQSDKTKELNKVRPLTTKERSLIQTFPESFKFIGSKSNIEQMIGNAVPVKMAEFIAKVIINRFNS